MGGTRGEDMGDVHWRCSHVPKLLVRDSQNARLQPWARTYETGGGQNDKELALGFARWSEGAVDPMTVSAASG